MERGPAKAAAVRKPIPQRRLTQRPRNHPAAADLARAGVPLRAPEPWLSPPAQRALLSQVARNGGNRAAQDVAYGRWPPALRRQDGPAQSEEVTPEFFGLSEVQAIRARMQLRFLRAQSYALESVRTADAVKSSLLRLSNMYTRAWERYARVVGAGRAEARNQQDWMNICVGIGVGILLGVGAAFVLPSAPAAAFTITLQEAAIAGASAAGQAIGGTLITSGVTSVFRIEGTELSPEGMEPAVLRMEIWRRAAEMYRDAVSFVPTATNLHLLAMAGEYLAGQIRTRVAGGEVDMSDDDMLDLLEVLVRADNAMQRVDAELQAAVTRLQQVRQRLTRGLPEGYGSREMEQDIWVLWMSQLPPSQYDVLDLDAIEDYLHGSIGILGPNSLLGVDFGWWTSDADERDAVRAAQRRADMVRDRFRLLQEGG